ncbi:DNA repair protein RadC [Alcanivorax sp.]|uniref:RadC family protein n=1 Tax=Alcanivorax sp. TaxID=1872427 RepID=UPI0025BF3FB4|nr:DNA repair protein RadC [Alcanivorax sp.]
MSREVFERNNEGSYRVRGLVRPEEIVAMASSILLHDLRGKEALTNPTDAASFLQVQLAGEEEEVFSVLYLDSKHRLLAYERLFYGTIDAATVYPRVVVKRSLHWNAAALILAHNHPSGIAEPSQADKGITNRLKDALSLIDVKVLDHIVVGVEGWCSMAERGWL